MLEPDLTSCTSVRLRAVPILMVDDSASRSRSHTKKLPVDATESEVPIGRIDASTPPCRCRLWDEVELLLRFGSGSDLGGPSRPLLFARLSLAA